VYYGNRHPGQGTVQVLETDYASRFPVKITRLLLEELLLKEKPDVLAFFVTFNSAHQRTLKPESRIDPCPSVCGLLWMNLYEFGSLCRFRLLRVTFRLLAGSDLSLGDARTIYGYSRRHVDRNTQDPKVSHESVRSR
jgi:hypothetical protein